ncbi:MAG: hypothetical protein IKI88_07145 [Anaerotignum sp.]|nr:hypothetical protein [Anaerotignum sp.]
MKENLRTFQELLARLDVVSAFSFVLRDGLQNYDDRLDVQYLIAAGEISDSLSVLGKEFYWLMEDFFGILRGEKPL